MRYSHPVHNINISSDLLDCLVEEFEELINSKRLRSQISKISELIDVLWKRNIFHSDKSASNTLLKYISNDSQREVVRNYIGVLNLSGNADGSGNVYGLFNPICHKRKLNNDRNYFYL